MVDLIGDKVRILAGCCHTIFSTGPNMLYICQHIVPRLLMLKGYDDCMGISVELISAADNDPGFLQKIFTGDKT
jgi:hypothetical protein